MNNQDKIGLIWSYSTKFLFYLIEAIKMRGICVNDDLDNVEYQLTLKGAENGLKTRIMGYSADKICYRVIPGSDHKMQITLMDGEKYLDLNFLEMLEDNEKLMKYYEMLGCFENEFEAFGEIGKVLN